MNAEPPLRGLYSTSHPPSRTAADPERALLVFATEGTGGRNGATLH
jgi:hypothetical protein